MYPPYLFTHRENFLARWESADRILLFLDFDGTLAPIASRPDRARLSRRNRGLLESLNSVSKVQVGVISGRGLSDLKKRVPVPGLLLAGNHGLEIQFRGRRPPWVHPRARRFSPLIAHRGKTLRQQLSRFTGVLVEEKGFSLSIHYRRVRPEQTAALLRAARKLLAPDLAAGNLQVRPGKKVMEIRPPFDWGKGDALRLIHSCLAASLGRKRAGGKAGNQALAVYIGDDETDEEAFAVLEPGFRKRGAKSPLPLAGIGIKVGRSARTRASYWLRDPEEVSELLETCSSSFR